MNITIFCSAEVVGQQYQDAAHEVATEIGKRGHALVWGGSNMGMMKLIADSTEAAGAKLIGISVEKYRENARPGVADMVVTKNLSERKAKLLERADAILVLTGGLGTLDEVTEILEYKKQEAHNKPIVFLNTHGFYDGFKTLLERMDREGFLPKKLAEYMFFADTPGEAMKYIEDNAKA